MKNKNKFFSLLILMLIALFGNCVKVSAMEYKADSIPNNAYVIGNHMFTEKVVLTTKHIMLGSTTIDSDSLSDMVIYYKTPWGEWWDGLSGEVVTVPDSFDIQYIDTERIISFGDINADDVLNTEDVTLIRRYIAGKEEFTDIQKLRADVNQDGDIDYVDVMILRKKGTGYDINLPYDSGEKYTITYDLDGGINQDGNIDVYAAISLPFKLDDPTKEGYIFLGWTGSNGDEPQKEVTIAKGTTGVLHYVANWELTDADAIDKSIPEAPTLTEITGIWKKDGTYEFVVGVCEEGAYYYPNVPEGAELYVKTIDGYTLVEDVMDETGLFEDILKTGETKVYVARTYIMYNDVKVYSNNSNELILTNENIITYNLNGGINSSNNPIGYSSTRQYDLVLEEPTKEGYVFIGWTGSNGDEPQKEVTIAKGTTGVLHYVANWLLYGDANADGKVNSNDSIIILDYLEGSADEIDLIAADVNLDGEVDNIDAVIILRFSFDFIEKLPYDSGDKYSINYNLDGGINDSRNPSVYAEISLAFTLEEPTKEGYEFTGWTGSNGDVPQKEVTIDENTTGDLEYTAHWILIEQ